MANAFAFSYLADRFDVDDIPDGYALVKDEETGFFVTDETGALVIVKKDE